MAIAFVAVAAALAGCRTGDTPATKSVTTIDTLLDQAVEKKFTSQVKLLKDRSVTKEDLRSAFADYRRCVGNLGFSVVGPNVNRIDGWRLLSEVNYGSIRDDGLVKKSFECTRTHYSLIEVGYEITHTARMDRPLMDAVRECLTKRDVVTTGRELNVADLIAGTKSKTSAVSACISEASHRLYPTESTVIAH